MAVAFEGREGIALASAFDDLLAEQQQSGLLVQLPDYPEVFQTAFADRAVRRPEKSGATLHIYGPLESRLMQADRVIVGGLIEGVWPPAPRTDPWLSRPMRHELGLDLPERRIGLSAHDFAQLLGSRRRDPQPLRQGRRRAGGRLALPASAGSGRGRSSAGTRPSKAGEQYVDFALALDAPDEVKPVSAARAEAASRDAAAEIVRHRDRGLAARSLHHLCQAYPQAGAARSRRHAAVGGRSRLGDPRCAR